MMSPGSSSGSEVGDGFVDDGGGDHEPDGARLLQLLDEVGERGCAGGFFFGEFFDGFGEHVEDDAFVAAADEAANHVGAHAAEADHSELHG